MDDQAATVAPGSAVKVRRRSPPAAFAGKVRELGDVMTSAPMADWGVDE